MPGTAKEKKQKGTNTELEMLGVFLLDDDNTILQERLKERYVRHIKISDVSDLESVYEMGKELGRGSFGTVLAVTDKQTEKKWAMKIVSKQKAGADIKVIQREIHILKLVTHPHIIHLERVYETVEKIYMVLELCKGALVHIFKEKRVFTEEETKKVITELASAVNYLHTHDIVHRDLKLENILVAKNPKNPQDDLYIKVIDFGLGAIKTGVRYEDMFHDRCGTLIYMSPEVIATQSYSQQCDMWAMGVITYLLLSGTFPFKSTEDRQLADLICTQQPDYARIEAKCSPEVRNLLEKLLEKNPALRITAAEVEQHPWLQGKKLSESQDGGNVLSMMQKWKSDMKLPGTECDWLAMDAVTSTNTSHRSGYLTYRGHFQESDSSVDSDYMSNVVTTPRAVRTAKQPLPVAVQNIEFSRKPRNSDASQGPSVNTRPKAKSVNRSGLSLGFKGGRVDAAQPKHF